MTIYEAIGSHDQRLYSWWVVSWISAGIFEKGHLLLVYWRIQLLLFWGNMDPEKIPRNYCTGHSLVL